MNTVKVFPVFIQNSAKETRNLVDNARFKLIDTNRNLVKPEKQLANRLWFSGPEFSTLEKNSLLSLKISDKYILFSETEVRGNDMCMCDVICEKGEKNRDIDVYMCDVINKENANDCMCAVAINIEVNIENNLQLESFSSLFKFLRVMAFIYKLVEKLLQKIKIKMKKVKNKIEKNVPDINLRFINTADMNAASNLWLRHIEHVFHSKKYDDFEKNLNVFMIRAFFGEGLATHRYHTRRSTRYYYQQTLI